LLWLSLEVDPSWPGNWAARRVYLRHRQPSAGRDRIPFAGVPSPEGAVRRCATPGGRARTGACGTYGADPARRVGPHSIH